MHHSNIGFRIGADQFGFEMVAIMHGNGDFLRALDHVVIGDDIALVSIDDYAGAKTLGFLALRHVLIAFEETLEKRIIQ